MGLSDAKELFRQVNFLNSARLGLTTRTQVSPFFAPAEPRSSPSCFLDAHHGGNRCSRYCPFIDGGLCSAGGIVWEGRVASPRDVFHQLQLCWTLVIGVEMRVVKSPNSSFIHIRAAGRLSFILAQVWVPVCVCVCVFACVRIRESKAWSPTMRMDGAIMEVFNPWLRDWTITVQTLPQMHQSRLVSGSEIALGWDGTISSTTASTAKLKHLQIHIFRHTTATSVGLPLWSRATVNVAFTGLRTHHFSFKNRVFWQK